MGRPPEVSLCIPTFNDAATLADALRSATSQRGRDIEILVLDNASTDETPRLVAALAGSDARIRYLRHPENLGMAGNFNAAIRHSIGRNVLLLCADDALEAGCVERMAGALDERRDASMVVCGRWICDERLQPRRVHRLRGRPSLVDGGTLMRECFAYGNRIGEPSAVMFRREMAGPGFDDRYSQVLDLVMWFRLLERGPAVVLPEPLCRIRTHPGQQSVRNIESGRVLLDKQRFFREFAPRLSRTLGFMETLSWDARMASTCARTPGARDAVPAEVFHPGLYRWALAPAARAGWAARTAL